MLAFLTQHAGTIGLLLFVSVFLSVVVWAYRPRAKTRIENYKNIPLREEDA
jgi:cbb3-type cytochrome oxidase subunit 3